MLLAGEKKPIDCTHFCWWPMLWQPVWVTMANKLLELKAKRQGFANATLKVEAKKIASTTTATVTNFTAVRRQGGKGVAVPPNTNPKKSRTRRSRRY